MASVIPAQRNEDIAIERHPRDVIASDSDSSLSPSKAHGFSVSSKESWFATLGAKDASPHNGLSDCISFSSFGFGISRKE